MNKKVMAMFEKAEDEYNDLMSKKNIIEVCAQIFWTLVYLPLPMLILSLHRMTSPKLRRLLKSLMKKRRKH